MYKEEVAESHLSKGLVVLFVALALVMFNSRESTHYDVTGIDAMQANALITGGALVFDVRSKKAYDEEHIPGAISLPLDQLEAGVPSEYDAATTGDIVVYCGDGVTTGPKATALLNEAGFGNAVNLSPGLSGWKNAGYAVTSQKS